MRLAILDNPANAIAEGLTGRDYLSHTQVTTYQACPLRWYFQYVAALPHEQVGSGLVFGGAIHAAIEHHYRVAMTGDPIPTLNGLLAAFDVAWQSDAKAPIQFGKGETATSLRDLASRMLATFLESESAEPQGTLVGIEEEIRSPYIPEVPDLLARVDLITLTDDALVIRDFKTTRNRWTADKAAESAAQLVLYGDLAAPIAEAYGARSVRLEFVVLTKTQSPRVEVFPVEGDAGQLARSRRVIARVWQAMRAGHIYPNPTPLNCTYCPFQRACRNWCD